MVGGLIVVVVGGLTVVVGGLIVVVGGLVVVVVGASLVGEVVDSSLVGEVSVVFGSSLVGEVRVVGLFRRASGPISSTFRSCLLIFLVVIFPAGLNSTSFPGLMLVIFPLIDLPTTAPSKSMTVVGTICSGVDGLFTITAN